MPLHAVRNSKGLTLIEVLISLVIVSTSLVFVLNALAKIAEAQREVEVRSSAYSFLASKMAELEQRVQPQGEMKESVKGNFRANDLRYDWELSTGFFGVAPVEGTGQAAAVSSPLVLTKDFVVGWKRGTEAAAMKLSTLSIVLPPKVEA